MRIAQSLPWIDPLTAASTINESHWVFLHSAVQTSYSGRFSYFACGLQDKIEADNIEQLHPKLSNDLPVFDNSWFGYLGYGLKNTLENLDSDAAHWPELADLCMMQFAHIYQFDHEQKTLTLWSETEGAPQLIDHRPTATSLPAATQLRSNMSASAYLNKASEVIERIRAGELYQANLTRKFMGNFDSMPDAFAIFSRLCEVSPAPYSAYIRSGDNHIISSSPELFLRISADGKVITRPIKGTAPRGTDSNADQKARDALASSSKDKAENLMIVDLMRNDLARSCIPGSVNVDSLFDITTHPTIHHMSSTISGIKRSDAATLEVVSHCFPPGSMTGAPKIRAMNLCSNLERLKRGVYSGAIGWFGGDGTCELSVVIRTLIVRGAMFEFQVGGGIVADSTPESELQELYAKSKGLCNALGITLEELIKL